MKIIFLSYCENVAATCCQQHFSKNSEKLKNFVKNFILKQKLTDINQFQIILSIIGVATF